MMVEWNFDFRAVGQQAVVLRMAGGEAIAQGKVEPDAP